MAMNTVADLQDRISEAFGVPVHHAPRPDESGPESAAVTETGRSELRRLLPCVAGMLLAVAIFAAGLVTGHLAPAGALGAVIWGSSLIFLLQKKVPPPPIHAAASAMADERLALLGDVHAVLGELLVVRDEKRRIVYANSVFRILAGHCEPVGRTCEEIGLAFRPHDALGRFDVEIASASGQRIFVWQDVGIAGLTHGVARDVTEERLAAAGEELARIRAETTSAAKSRLLATVAHEIRTPLGGILGMGQLLDNTALTPEQRSYLTGIRQSGQALSQLVDDLLDFSTIEVGRFNLRPQSVALRPLIESVVEMLSHRAHEKGIEIASIVAPQIPDTMSFDPARLRQVLFNVIGNAVKFTQEGGILIEAVIDAFDLLITVTDTGAGMTPAEQARIFGEFEQAGSSSERSAGTGLGLAISARIMREFGGNLSVASEKGSGSVFTIRMPHRLSGQTARRQREGELRNAHVLLMAPAGPASNSVSGTITALGGVCLRIGEAERVTAELDAARASAHPYTDIIVDHRLAAEFTGITTGRPDLATGLRKIFLVSPEQRNSQPAGVFDAWLIRPLRERSLVDVLCGRMRGMEQRDALNDNQPGLGVSVPSALAAGLRVWLAEDDPINALILRAALEKGGHEVRLLQDFTGLQAALDKDTPPDLLVTDLNMPGDDGFDFLARLRRGERLSGEAALPVIVLTADARDEVRRNGLLHGANRVFTKPVEPARLIAEIAALGPMCRNAATSGS